MYYIGAVIYNNINLGGNLRGHVTHTGEENRARQSAGSGVRFMRDRKRVRLGIPADDLRGSHGWSCTACWLAAWLLTLPAIPKGVPTAERIGASDSHIHSRTKHTNTHTQTDDSKPAHIRQRAGAFFPSPSFLRIACIYLLTPADFDINQHFSAAKVCAKIRC